MGILTRKRAILLLLTSAYFSSRSDASSGRCNSKLSSTTVLAVTSPITCTSALSSEICQPLDDWQKVTKISNKVNALPKTPQHYWLCAWEADGLIPTGCTCISTPQQHNLTITVTTPQDCISTDRNSGATVFFYNGFGGRPIVSPLMHTFKAMH